MSISPSTPVYFETSWAILSSIGIINILFGIAIIRLTTFSPIALIPIIISAASAVANGLCFYAYYTTYPTPNILIAAIFADITWLIQEAGLLFYSNLILAQLLQNRTRFIYLSLFWTLITILSLLRISILACRAHQILFPNSSLRPLISYLHTAYFLSLTLIELLSSYFLLRKLSSAKRTSMIFTNSSTLFSYLMKSTQIRGCIIALISIGRAAAFSVKGSEGSQATSWADELDRYFYLLECLFPIVMFIDILSSKLFITTQTLSRSRHPSPGPSPNRLSHTPSPSPSPYHSPTLSPYRSPDNSHSISRHQPSPEMRFVTHTERDIEEGNADTRTNLIEDFNEVETENQNTEHTRHIGERRSGRGIGVRDKRRYGQIGGRGGGADRGEYVIANSQDVVDSSSEVTKSTDFEFLVGRMGPVL